MGRSALPQFLSLIKPDQYSDQCPCGTGPGRVTHYLEDCPHTREWHDAIHEERFPDVEEYPPITAIDMVDQFIPYVLHLVDHTSLGSDSWTREHGSPHTNTAAAFRKPVHTPLAPTFYHVEDVPPPHVSGWVNLEPYFPHQENVLKLYALHSTM